MGKTLDRRTARRRRPPPRVEDPGRPRDLRRPELGQGLLRHQQARPRHRPPGQGPGASASTSRSWSISSATAASSCRSCSASPTSSATASARSPRPSSNAIDEYDYQGDYCCVYPIKVNQQRHVVEEILDFGKPFDFGLEAGSKPELLAVLAVTNGDDDADHLQRLQGRRVHQDGHAGPQDRQEHHPGRREVHRAGADRQVRRGAGRPASRSACASSWPPRARAGGESAPATAPSSA